jgi:gamma-glutamylcyclotransferase (GGCT)/AIG2-like uncharacterized protein YtfP
MTGSDWEAHQLLFAYGTLLQPTGDPDVDAAVGSAARLGAGYIHARLYDLGDYPGAQPVPEAGTRARPKVWGSLLGFADPAPVFAVLDRYEGCVPGEPRAGEFRRAPAPVTLPASGRTLLAQAYFYNPSAQGKPLIVSGDYQAHRRARTGSRTGNR